jgi:uncharacterized protein YukE
MNADGFEYNHAAVADYVHAVASASGQLDEIRGQAQHALALVQSALHGNTGDSYTQCQQLINQGIDAGQEVIRRHSMTVDNSHQDMMGTDSSSAAMFT